VHWQQVATTETHTNDMVKKIKIENMKLKYTAAMFVSNWEDTHWQHGGGASELQQKIA